MIAPRRPVTLDDLLAYPSLGPIRLSDLALITGWSRRTLRREAYQGHLRAFQLLPRGVLWIQRPEALAYLRSRGFLQARAS